VRLLLIACVLIVLKQLIAAIESRLVFFPSTGEDVTPGALGIPYRRVWINTSDDQRLAAWQFEPDDPIADVVYFHGNGGNLAMWLPILAQLHRHRLRVLAVDYRGYGLSSGSPSEAGVYLDAEATVRHAGATRASPPPRPLVYWGRSLGGAVAAAATRVMQPDGVVLESAFPEKAAVIRRQPILRALNAFATYRFPTVEHLREFDRPVLVMHGDRDSVIPFALGQELFDALQGPKTFATIRGGDHNDSFDAGDRAYWNPVLAFIGRLSRASP
jgi:fermentation-respiration switch protein FrsA (DUF1100 family)